MAAKKVTEKIKKVKRDAKRKYEFEKTHKPRRLAINTR